MEKILIYGAYGYTGKLITERCKQVGIKPVLSGRNEIKLKALASEYGFDHRACDLKDSSDLDELLKDFDVVIHAAGPFKFTAQPMMEACLRTKTHYLDITGEIEIFEMGASYDKQAKEAGIMVMPGTGMDVVPSDCLAVHLKNRLPDANRLQLAFTSTGGLSRGTAKTVVENLGRGGAVRVNHKIKVVPTAYKSRTVDFGEFKTPCFTIPWGDVATSYRSTGIPDIEVYTGGTKAMVRNMKLSNYFNWLLKTDFVRSFLKKKIDQRPPGPSEKKRAKTKTYFWGRVANEEGESKTSLLQTLDGYSLTAITSVEIAKRTCDGKQKVGYQTPAMVFGPDFILEVEGSERQDVD